MTIMLMLTSLTVLLDRASTAMGRLTAPAPIRGPSMHTHTTGSFYKRQVLVLL